MIVKYGTCTRKNIYQLRLALIKALKTHCDTDTLAALFSITPRMVSNYLRRLKKVEESNNTNVRQEFLNEQRV